MIPRLLVSLFLLGCGTSQPPASFTCGDAGPTCQSATEFCDIVTHSGASPSVTQSCKPFPSGCSFCACLTDSGVANTCAIGTSTCTPEDNGTYTVTESCIQ